MQTAILKLGKHTLIYGFGNIASRIVSFLLLPLFVRYLTPADYGILQICNVFHNILLIILQMGLTSALFKVYYQEEDVFERKVILSSTIFFNVLSSMIIVVILYLLRSVIAPFAVGEEQSEILFTLVLGSVFFQVIITLGMSILRAEEKSAHFALFTVARVALYAGLNILFIAFLKRGYLGAMESTLLSMAAGFLLFIPLFLKRFVFVIRLHYIKELLQLGIPLAIGGLAVWVLNFTDRYMLMYLLPEGEAMIQVGVYSLGAKFALMIKFFLVAPFTLSWGALMFAYQNDPKAGLIYARVLNIFTFVGGIVFLLISLYGREVIAIMSTDPDYLQAYKVIPLLAFSNLLYGMYMVFSVGITLAKKTYYVTITNFAAALSNVLLNYVLITKMGMMGAVIASAVSFLLMTFLLYLFAQRFYHIPYQTGRIIAYLTLLLGVITANFLAEPAFLVKILLTMFLLPVLPVFRLVTYKDVEKSFHLGKSYLTKLVISKRKDEGGQI